MANKRNIIAKDDVESLVIDYQPKQFPLRIMDSASGFVNSQEVGKRTDFKISELAADQAGIAQLNRENIEAQVEAESLQKLKEIEEKAYQEAYELGLIEGSEKAFKDHQEELGLRMQQMDELLKTIEFLKTELVAKNEYQILKLLNLMASKIAMTHVECNQDAVIEVIKQVIEVAQTEEDVLLYVSLDDFMFLESLREKMDKKIDFLRRVKIESSDEVQSGGCILETKFGAIDARLEQRFKKAWEAIERKMPRVNSKFFNEDKEVVEPDQKEPNKKAADDKKSKDDKKEDDDGN